MDQKSPVIQLLDLVWSQTNTATGHSWERLNHAMQRALQIAVSAGFPFAQDDMGYIATHYRFGYWCGESSEWIYTAAVAAANMTAIQSYEQWQKRKPFMMDNVDLYQYSSYIHGKNLGRKRERLTVGSRFYWKGYKVKVTSFADDGQSVTACSYKPRPEGTYKDVIEKRFCITHADLKAERQERQERGQLMKLLTNAARGEGSPDTILAALGVTTKEELDRLPIAKLRKVASQYAATSEIR